MSLEALQLRARPGVPKLDHAQRISRDYRPIPGEQTFSDIEGCYMPRNSPQNTDTPN